MDQYLVYGNPIKQSKSPFIHQSFAKSTNQHINYESELVEVGQFSKAVNAFIAKGGIGANVTAPFKHDALAMCDELSERARLAGAVNTLSFTHGKILGDNTDGIGLVQDLLRNKVKLSQSNILILGAGGATKGVILPLLEQSPDTITIANRTVSKAEDICDQFNDDRLSSCGFESLNQPDFDLIINATSASLSGKLPAITGDVINSGTVCYDMVYSKSLTPFLVWSKEQGVTHLIDGLGMLVGQAAESFSIWRGVQPEVETVITALRSELMNS